MLTFVNIYMYLYSVMVLFLRDQHEPSLIQSCVRKKSEVVVLCEQLCITDLVVLG